MKKKLTNGESLTIALNISQSQESLVKGLSRGSLSAAETLLLMREVDIGLKKLHPEQNGNKFGPDVVRLDQDLRTLRITITNPTIYNYEKEAVCVNRRREI